MRHFLSILALTAITGLPACAEESPATKPAAEAVAQAPRAPKTAKAPAPPSSASSLFRKQVVYMGPRRKMEKGTYLGVATIGVPPALREQLNLQKGFGLVVDSMEKDSPAEQAGLQKYDIIQKLGDQQLIDQRQLQVLVRSYKPGDNLTLSILRKGQPMTLTATLIEKDVPEISENVIDTDGASLTLTRGPTMENWMGKGNVGQALSDLNVNANGDASYVYKQRDHTMELIEKDGSRHLVDKDDHGKTLFDGYIDTDEQRASLPPETARALKRMDEKFHAAENTARAEAERKAAEAKTKSTGGDR